MDAVRKIKLLACDVIAIANLLEEFNKKHKNSFAPLTSDLIDLCISLNRSSNGESCSEIVDSIKVLKKAAKEQLESMKLLDSVIGQAYGIESDLNTSIDHFRDQIKAYINIMRDLFKYCAYSIAFIETEIID